MFCRLFKIRTHHTSGQGLIDDGDQAWGNSSDGGREVGRMSRGPEEGFMELTTSRHSFSETGEKLLRDGILAGQGPEGRGLG